MARRPHPTTLDVLREARYLIAARHNSFLCFAIEAAHTRLGGETERSTGLPPASSPAGKLLLRIDKALTPYATANTWLVYVAGVPLSQVNYRGRMREYRLRWIDQLIKEYS